MRQAYRQGLWHTLLLCWADLLKCQSHSMIHRLWGLMEADVCLAGGSGVALRTLVYHEVMVGYLDYIKRQGFTSMFIWACPPLQVWHTPCSCLAVLTSPVPAPKDALPRG